MSRVANITTLGESDQWLSPKLHLDMTDRDSIPPYIDIKALITDEGVFCAGCGYQVVDLSGWCEKCSTYIEIP